MPNIILETDELPYLEYTNQISFVKFSSTINTLQQDVRFQKIQQILQVIIICHVNTILQVNYITLHKNLKILNCFKFVFQSLEDIVSI